MRETPSQLLTPKRRSLGRKVHGSDGQPGAQAGAFRLRSIALILLATAACGESDSTPPTNRLADGGGATDVPKVDASAGLDADVSGADADGGRDQGQACEDFVEVGLGGRAVVQPSRAQGTVLEPDNNPGAWTLEFPAGPPPPGMCFAVVTGEMRPFDPPAWLEPLGELFRLEPAGFEPEPPAVLHLRYDQGNMREAGIEEHLLGVHTLDPASGDVLEASVTDRDFEANTVVVELSRLSPLLATRYAIRLTSSGIVVSAEAIEIINARIETVLSSFPTDEERLALLSADAELLGLFVDAAQAAGVTSFVASLSDLGVNCLSTINCDDGDGCTEDRCIGVSEGCRAMSLAEA